MEHSATAPQANTKPDKFIIRFMIIAHVLALAALPFASVPNFIAAGILYFVTACLGITLGYHRLLTHRSFQVPKWLERFFAVCGVTALQGSPLEWVGHHRMHHAHSDKDGDPHNASRGFWFSHIGWLFEVRPEVDDDKLLRRYARDISSDPFYRFLEKPAVQIGWQVFLGMVLLAIGGWSMMFWGIWVRLIAVYHGTWFVNSAAHMWGYKNYPDVDDLATNNWWVALLTFGEGWHNNHHKYGNVAKAGHRWWEIDVTYWIIAAMGAVGLATKIRPVPVSGAMADSAEPSKTHDSRLDYMTATP